MRRFVLVMIAISCLLALSTSGEAIGLPGSATDLPAMQRSGSNLRFTPLLVREANRKLRYTIKARYPQVIGARNNPRLVALNRELKQFVVDQVNGFKKDFSAPEEPMMSGGSTFDIRYQVEFSSNDLVSIGFIVNAYFEGAIHGQYNIVSFNYDLSTGRRLKLADLFKPDATYINAISDYSIKSLRKTLGTDSDLDWIKNGAGAEEKNYDTWNITRKGLEITFNPYQVASYADGPQIVVVPVRVLKDVVDPKGPLARIIGKQ